MRINARLILIFGLNVNLCWIRIAVYLFWLEQEFIPSFTFLGRDLGLYTPSTLLRTRDRNINRKTGRQEDRTTGRHHDTTRQGKAFIPDPNFKLK
jgi:hypothetical protein